MTGPSGGDTPEAKSYDTTGAPVGAAKPARFAKPPGCFSGLFRWGAGPLIGAVTVVWTGLMLVVGHLWPDVVSVTGIALQIFTAAGLSLLALGIPFYVAVALYFRSHRRKEGLVTTGPYGFLRHPLYTIGFLFLAPGVVLLLGSWPLLSVPVVMYAAARLLVPIEEHMLFNTFGGAYAEYFAATGAFCPTSVKPACQRRRTTR